jgi:AcrR family transcriptional regulator
LGVRERQERDREAVARAILDAARDLFVAEGYRNVSIRKIAEKIEYSPAAIYSYFPSKDDIFLALAEEGFRLLLTSKPAPTEWPTRVDAIRAALWHLYTFSKAHPEYYALMFLDRSVPRISADWERFGFVRDMKVEMSALIQQAIDAGELATGSHPLAVFRILLAAIHGAATMRLCDRLEAGEDGDGLARDTLEAAIIGLRTGFTHHYHPGSFDHCN